MEERRNKSHLRKENQSDHLYSFPVRQEIIHISPVGFLQRILLTEVIFQPSIKLVLGDRNQHDLQDRAHGPLLYSFLHIAGQLVLGRSLWDSKESIILLKSCKNSSHSSHIDFNERNFITYVYLFHL